MTRDEVNGILQQHPRLNFGGYGLGCGERKLSPSERMGKIDGLRAHLLDDESIAQIGKVCDWINANLEMQKTTNLRMSSYGLKHVVEKEIGYVSNGQFIVAALLCGYCIGKVDYNVFFNIKQSSIKRTCKKVGYGC